MNKFINKALFYKEWINAKWITLFTIFILIYFKVYGGVISGLSLNKLELKANGTIWTNRWFNNGLYLKNNYSLVMALVIIVLAVILFIGEKTSETQGFIASMPFTRNEIIFNKWFVGVVSILISFVVATILLSLVYVVNINSIDTTLNPYSDLIKWFFMDVFQYLCIFTFMIFAQVVMGNIIMSGVVGGIILLIPCYLPMLIWEVFMMITKRDYVDIQGGANWLDLYNYNSTGRVWTKPVLKNNEDLYSTFYYTNYGLKLLVLFILTCLFLYLAFLLYKKRNLEYNLRLTVFKNLEPVLIWGMALFLGLFAGAFIGLGYSGDSLKGFGICTIIFTVLGYFVAKLLLKLLSARK